MTKRQGRSGTIDVKAVLAEDEEFLRALVRTALQEVLEVEMTEALGAEKGRTGGGPAGLPVGLLRPDADHADRQTRAAGAGGPRRALLDRAVRALSAVGAGAGGALAEMSVQGVSTRKVKAAATAFRLRRSVQ